MSIRSEIMTQFAQVGKENDKRLVSLTDDLPLLNTGLDSLCLAIIVVRLENVFGFDPFVSEDVTEVPVTVGEFIRLYEAAALLNRKAIEAVTTSESLNQ